MCGFVGFFNLENINHEDANNALQIMTDSLIHRGPDAGGTFSDLENNLYLGHRRLSILDTSDGGLQPMKSKSGNLVIVFNGEIYNHNELRTELQQEGQTISWDSSSDTETLLAAFEFWGIQETLPKLRGMFSIAIWDRLNNNFYLIRDRFGEKPLYFGWIKGEGASSFGFASELKALKKYPNFFNKISHSALVQFFTYMYVPCPMSIFENIYKLEPGCILKINSQPPVTPPKQTLHSVSGSTITYENISISRWYDLKQIVEKASTNLFTNFQEASDTLEEELLNVIKMQRLSDVPLGAFLSGGVDSSLIVALMQKQSTNPIKTFTIGFENPDFNEAPFAEAVSSQLRTDHSELLVTASDAQSVIPNLAHLYDEPFADYSQIPTYFVCKSAKQSVTVSLSGDAGDELFGGYNRYLMAPMLWERLSWLPKIFRKFIGKFLIFIPIGVWDYFFKCYCRVLKKDTFFNQFGDKVHKFGERLLEVNNEDDLFFHLISEPNAKKLVKNQDSQNTVKYLPQFLSDQLPVRGADDFASKMMYRDTLNYLTDDILCKVDRAAMGVSLETRVPFLDHKIVELAWRMPAEMKLKNSEGKIILRNILYKYVPKELIERPKAGFSIPLGDWLKGPLKEWAEPLICSSRLEREGYLNANYVNKLWEEHLSGKRNWTFRLWSILIFQSWLESNYEHLEKI